jgi:hypothetical protein
MSAVYNVNDPDSTICHNAPHNFLMRWADPVADLDGSLLPADTWQTYTLPAQVCGLGC